MAGNRKRILDLTRIAAVAALYVALTFAFMPIAFGKIQFRFAEMLMLLVCYRKKYAFSMIIGCAIVNFFSPLGIVDVVVGTLATGLACLCMLPLKNIWLASLFPTLCCVLIGLELHYVSGEPFWLAALTVMAGEFVVVTLVGCPVMKLLERSGVLERVL